MSDYNPKLFIPPDEPIRVRLPDTRKAITHHFVIFSAKVIRDKTVVVQTDGYITVGLYDDGRPGEIFLALGKIGNATRVLLDAWCTMASIHLQCGALIDDIAAKFRGWQCEPRGMTKTPGINQCSSPLDYVAQWLMMRFGSDDGFLENVPDRFIEDMTIDLIRRRNHEQKEKSEG